MKKVNGLETVMMRKSFRLGKKEEEDWKTYRTRTSGLMRKTWKKDDMSILDRYCCAQDVAGDGMGNGESKCSSIRSAASYIFSETHVAGRRGRERGMRTDLRHSTRWKHMRAHRNRGVVGDTAVSKWAGGWKEGRRTRRQRTIQQQPYWQM